LIIEAWAQGYMVGSLIIMAALAVANMRKGVLLHKLIVLEVSLFSFSGHGSFVEGFWAEGELDYGRPVGSGERIMEN
jgi:hypothetical protein